MDPSLVFDQLDAVFLKPLALDGLFEGVKGRREGKGRQGKERKGRTLAAQHRPYARN